MHDHKITRMFVDQFIIAEMISAIDKTEGKERIECRNMMSEHINMQLMKNDRTPK